MDEVSNLRDKYLKEYRVKNTNISILKKSKIAWHSYPDIKHLHLNLKANLTEEKQPHAQHESSGKFIIQGPRRGRGWWGVGTFLQEENKLNKK